MRHFAIAGPFTTSVQAHLHPNVPRFCRTALSACGNRPQPAISFPREKAWIREEQTLRNLVGTPHILRRPLRVAV